MNGITSSLFGTNFPIKLGFSYTTRIVEIDKQGNCRLKITFDETSVMPVTIYVRYMNDDGTINDSHPNNLLTSISSSQGYMAFTVSGGSKVMIIFEYRILSSAGVSLLFDIKKENINNEFLSDFYMFESRSGLPYADHQIGTYSEYEFTEKTGLSGLSKFTDKTRASRILIGHKHENDRGTLNRMCVIPKTGKSHKNKVMSSDVDEWIYLDPLENYQTPMSNSNRVIRGILLKTTD